MAPSKNAAGGTELAVRKADPVSKVEIDLLGDEVASIPQTAARMPRGLNDQDGLRSDFKQMKNLLTCSVCDQMLHEPWTIACGHTYCYSCLSSWFTQNRHKKTCPECRSTVTDMPAPAFVIKQIVDIYVNRLIQEASDPSQENHEERRKEERRAVEDDRASVDGLFKGCFNSSRPTRIVYDQSDRVYRCASCGHEFEGSAHCMNCGVSYEGENEAIEEDYIGSGLDEAEFDMDADDFEDGENFELDPEDFDGPGAYFAANDMAAVGFPPELARLHAIRHFRHHNHGRNNFQQFDSENDDDDDDDDDDEQGEDSDSSMRDFIEEVEPSEHESIESPRGPRRRVRPQISDGEDEDDSSIVVTQPRRARQSGERGNRSRPQIIDSDDEVDSDGNSVVDTTSGEERARYSARRQTTTVQDSDDESSDSEHEDSFLGFHAHGDESVEGGWSSLDGGGSENSETNAGAFQDYQEEAHGSQYAEYQSDTDSDATPTLHTTNVPEAEGDEDEEGGASTNRLMAAPDPPSRRFRPWEGPDDFNRPGEEEMYEFACQRRASASSLQQPQMARKRQSRRPHVISSDEEEDVEDQSVDDAMESSPEVNTTRNGRRDGENLGQVNYVHGDDEQSSEESVQPPRRRRRLFRFEGDEQIVTPRRLRMTTSGDSSGATSAMHLANPWDDRGQLARNFTSPSPRSHRRLYYAPRDTISGGYARREQTFSNRPNYTVDSMGAITSPVLFRISPRRRADYY